MLKKKILKDSLKELDWLPIMEYMPEVNGVNKGLSSYHKIVKIEEKKKYKICNSREYSVSFMHANVWKNAGCSSSVMPVNNHILAHIIRTYGNMEINVYYNKNQTKFREYLIELTGNSKAVLEFVGEVEGISIEEYSGDITEEWVTVSIEKI